jgi:hypothetical protein
MKRAVPILILILILILRQAPSALIEDQRQGPGSNLTESNLLIGAQGLGWLEIIDKGDSCVLSPVFEASQHENTLFLCNAAIRHFRYLPHCFTNPLLIDRPPPIWKTEFINFA